MVDCLEPNSSKRGQDVFFFGKEVGLLSSVRRGGGESYVVIAENLCRTGNGDERRSENKLGAAHGHL